MIPACDEDLLLLVQFILDRFMGQLPDEQVIMNAIEDWRRSLK